MKKNFILKTFQKGRLLKRLGLTFSFILLSSLGSSVYAQTCDTEVMQEELEKANPSIREARLNAENRLLAVNAKKFLENSGVDFSKKNTVYEIPVVVHVIVPTGSAIGTAFNRTDEQIKTWLDNANKMFATTFGNGYYNEGTGVDGGTVFPIKLVLAKRDASCNATTGIVRYDGGQLPGYDTYGVKRRGANGVTTDQVRALAPHWPESSFYNIYIMNKVDGGGEYGIMGWAGYPTNPDVNYESFMKSFVVTLNRDNTLAHEFGHAMGLMHTFEVANANGGECPPNANCAVDNDKVCDTEPGQSLVSATTPTNAAVNPCTGELYQGVQYNIMNYTKNPRKFTPGQRDRALAQIMMLRPSLLNSKGGLAPDGQTIPEPKAADCAPSSVVVSSANYGMGPRLVKLGDINHGTSGGWHFTVANDFYYDYTKIGCLNNAISTSLDISQSHNLEVGIAGNTQNIRAWIDFNNDGVFDNSELVLSVDNFAAPSFESTTIYSQSFTAPATAVRNIPLRMRVRADNGSEKTACGNLTYGQIEDYSVTFTGELAVDSIDKSKTVVYPNPVNSVLNISTVSDVEVYNLTGQKVGSYNGVSKVNMGNLVKGTYIVVLKGKDGKASQSIKVIKQ